MKASVFAINLAPTNSDVLARGKQWQVISIKYRFGWQNVSGVLRKFSVGTELGRISGICRARSQNPQISPEFAKCPRPKTNTVCTVHIGLQL